MSSAIQVYSTLSRLERDLVAGADAEGRLVCEISAAGEEEVRRWSAAPPAPDSPGGGLPGPRDAFHDPLDRLSK